MKRRDHLALLSNHYFIDISLYSKDNNVHPSFHRLTSILHGLLVGISTILSINLLLDRTPILLLGNISLGSHIHPGRVPTLVMMVDLKRIPITRDHFRF